MVHVALVSLLGNCTFVMVQSIDMGLAMTHALDRISLHYRFHLPRNPRLQRLIQVPAPQLYTFQSNSSSVVWAPADLGLIKHIPKSARVACASHLASVLRKVVSNPDSSSNWLELFNWGRSVLCPPKRGGRRHNLSRIIRQRISSFTGDHCDNDSVKCSKSAHQQRRSTPGLNISAKTLSPQVKTVRDIVKIELDTVR